MILTTLLRRLLHVALCCVHLTASYEVNYTEFTFETWDGTLLPASVAYPVLKPASADRFPRAASASADRFPVVVFTNSWAIPYVRQYHHIQLL